MKLRIEKEREESGSLGLSNLGSRDSDDSSSGLTCDRYGHPLQARKEADKSRADLIAKMDSRLGDN